MVANHKQSNRKILPKNDGILLQSNKNNDNKSVRNGQNFKWRNILYNNLTTMWVKKVAPPPLKLFAIFSLMVNLCKWKLPWLLHKHIAKFTPILVHLSEYLYDL